ncbi:hypothetical protein K1T71_007954 [Dendrolimus kikuchii]|uniref:Uncharacterized protein n=1 Tax=Dendrolimus kikuchii TaxID=765133 RepID=A0ACC1CYS3_9NEOP|nr:hypothetical protein K1T71_007954 [Dendrolimus kikuchii]
MSKKTVRDEAEISHGYFQGHHCDLPADKISAYYIKCGRCRKFILDWTTVHTGDIRACILYRSYAGLCAEKYRQYKFFPCVIHPYSKLRIILDTIFIIIILTTNTFVAVQYSMNVNSVKEHYNHLMTILDMMYLITAISNFFTGYIAGISYKYTVLNLKKVAWKYLTRWFLVDLFSSWEFLLCLSSCTAIGPHLLIDSTKILRFPLLVIYLGNVMTVLRVGIFKRTLIDITVLILSYLSWNVFFQYLVEYIQDGKFRPENKRECSWITIGGLWNATTVKRFTYAWDRAVGMLRKNSNMNLIAQKGCFANFFVVAWIIGKLVICHCTLKFIISLFGHESARARYYIMTKQVENYMNQRKFPLRIKQKILKFYAIRFQSNFFMEHRMLNLMTGQLREDIIMHTGRQLVRELEFLKQLPRPLLLQIGLKLSIVIFIAGDIIFKINTVGDCLYFIDKGTVAIYSESGREICHLEDGDFFGEIALVMKHKLRTASVVAVTNCELFRLDREDFDSSIACYPTVYEDIKKVATSRFERTCVLDEHHKAEMQMANFKKDLP